MTTPEALVPGKHRDAAPSLSRAGFRGLYDEHAPRVYAICLRMTGGDKASAEDLTQEVFVRVWRRRERFGGWGTVGAWIRRIAVNLALNHQRGERRRTERLRRAAEPRDARGGTGSDPVDRLALEAAIRNLPDGARRILVLHDIEGYRQREIAKMVRVSVGTVKSQLHRARRLLRERLEG